VRDVRALLWPCYQRGHMRSNAVRFCRVAVLALSFLLTLSSAPLFAAPVTGQPGLGAPEGERRPHAGGEASLVLPDLAQEEFLGVDGRSLLFAGLFVTLAGMAFGFVIYRQLRDMPVHRAMLEVSELIYETCKTYLQTQGRFLMILEVFIAVIIVLYFGVLQGFEATRVAIILIFSVIGILGSYGVAWFGIRVNTFANSRTAFASLRGKPFPCHDIPLKAGMSIGMMLISVELFIMLCILLFIPGSYAGPCFIGFAIGESLGAAALRIAGGIFTKIADIGSDLMKIVFRIKEDDARNPGVIADCTGDNAGDSVGPTADGFETYGVTGVALITFIMLAVPTAAIQVQLLVWIFVMRIVMILASGGSYLLNHAVARARYATVDQMNFEAPLTQLVWLTSIVSIVLTYVTSWLIIPNLGGDPSLWWKLSTIITCGTLAGAVIPELVKVFTSTGGGVVLPGRGRVAQYPVGFRRRQFQRVLVGGEHHRPDGGCIRREHDGPRYVDARARHLRVRPRRVRVPGYGSRNDCGRLVRPRHG
jgi:K(+)-stimulated pyrophosphate-energized sodium pump